MSDTRPPWFRRLLPWIGAAAFLVVAGIAIWRLFGLRDEAIERERARLQTFVEDQVTAWEEALVADLSDQLEAMAADPDRASHRQARTRKSRSWFDSLYLWSAPPDPEREPARFLYPTESAPRADELIARSQCLDFAEALMERYPGEPDLGIAAFVNGCRNEDPNVRLAATVQAAYWKAASDPVTALAVLEALRLPDNASLQVLAAQGIDPFRAAAWRMLRATLMLQRGQTDEGLDLMYALGEQVTQLDAPDLPKTKLFLDLALSELEQHGRPEEAARLRGSRERAERRVVAYREIATRILPTAGQARLDDPSRFIYDQYSDQPFLLYYGWSNGIGVGLQLEQQALLAEFLQTRLRNQRRTITITDANGSWVHGARAGGAYAVTVPFRSTLTHLRVCVRQSALDAAVANLTDQWVVPLVVIAICLGLGLAALGMLARADRRQQELLERQRAFTTRVTHELKTPLAGIRVMAENLELGAFRTDQQRQEMARRITDEVDRLTRRVDDVLAVARERTIPSPRPFEPDDVLLELVDEWAPRAREAGIQLHVDVGATDPIDGDARAFRDAVACLLDNAVKYRRDDRDDAQIWLELRQEGRQVVIGVADNGLGVPRAMRRAIFERFVRVEGPNRGKAGGHGLGLHQVKEIVAAHRGTVTCTEGPDGGARFEVRLPAKRG